MKTVCQVSPLVDGFSFDHKEVFILLLGYLGSAGVGANLKVTYTRKQPVGGAHALVLTPRGVNSSTVIQLK